MAQQLFEDFFRDAPAAISLGAIWHEWQAVRSPRSPYRVEDRYPPVPVWTRRGLAELGDQAWSILATDLRQSDPKRGIAIYIHIPFCARHCNFCDCYSFKLQSHRAEHIERYTRVLKQEIRLWSRLEGLAQRPISTVHFGGGTPPVLGMEAFSDIVQTCRDCFYIHPGTEWALETTSSELSPEAITALNALGFTRLHIGVQSLEDAVRGNLNRQETAAAVLDKISAAVSIGWIVSVDMIAGLPGQSLAGFLADLKTLSDSGVDGFSVYELQVSPHNRKWVEKYGLHTLPRLLNYFYLQAGGHYLAALGYRKSLFNHYARERDTNLYFTFPERSEDCLAMGTIADGVFGDYHYRHPAYPAYCRGVSESFPGLQGGLRRNMIENHLHWLTTGLLAGHIDPRLLHTVIHPALFQQWLDARLLAEDRASGQFLLTGNGSWFAGNMITQMLADVSV